MRLTSADEQDDARREAEEGRRRILTRDPQPLGSQPKADPVRNVPLQLPERCLTLHGLSKVGLVLDPFMGSGTTAVAAQRLNLPCIGFDIDADYVGQSGVRLQEGEGRQRDLGLARVGAAG